ncbi:hypothetical protein C3H65_09165 [Campylobacter jejuni]|uniref:glycosyltransferase family 10 domain-containing protein n=1 Tax=Campylobacter jejuni TaxID=197 RepID=UPI000F8002AB|nr:glycosyltransferase family 10 [Campylobacter jejuni]RTJ49124.1 hypothetical protein C3H65_09165 [Campylobacter jejuni]
MTNKRTIKLRLVDWYLEDNEENFYNHYLIKLLCEKYNIVYSNDPDYIIYSVFEFNRHTNYNCIRILYTEENRRTNWNIADYGIDFDYLSFADRHIRLPFQFLWLKDDIEMACQKHLYYNNFEKRKKFCAYLITDPGRPEWTPRDHFIDKLSLYKHIDSGGRYRNNIGGPIGDRYGEDFNITKRKWLQNYKFNICFENSSAPGYTSEKIFQAFAAGCIPIYWGDTSLRCGLGIKEKLTPCAEIDQRIPKIPEELLDYKINPKAFINAHNFSTWNELIDHIKLIDNNDELYFSMLNEPVFLNNFDPIQYAKEKTLMFFDYIFSQPLEYAYRRGKGAHINFELRDKKRCSADFTPTHKNIGALLRIQNQLSYKLGQTLILNSKSVLGFISLPFIILSIVVSHKQEQKAYKFKIKKNPNLALPPLSSYDDYNEALKIKNHFSYQLGEEFIKASKNWYKGGLFLLPYRVFKLYKKLGKKQ